MFTMFLNSKDQLYVAQRFRCWRHIHPPNLGSLVA